MREKVGKSRNTVFFQWFGAPEGRKVGSLKRRVAEPAGQMRDEKLHAVVARSTLRSENVQNTPFSDHSWKLRCRKSACRCGAKHISKSKCTKHAMVGALLEVEMSKKCTPLWREAHLEVKMLKTPGVRTTFGGSDVASRGRRKGLCTLSKVSKTWGFCSIFNYNYNSTTLHYITLHYTPLHYTTLHYTTLPSTTLHCITLHYTTLHYTTLASTTLHYITLHSRTLKLQLHNYTLLRSTTLNYTTLHYITLYYTPLHYTTLHYTTFHYTSLHYTTLHYTTTTATTTTTQLHSTTLRYTKLHYTPLHYTTLHYTTLHWMTLHHR